MRLTLNELKYIINESYLQLLTEITVNDAYTQYYSKINHDIYNDIVNIVQGNNVNLLPNTKWVLGCYLKYPQDTERWLNNLHTENKDGILDVYQRLKDINKIEERYRNLNNFSTVSALANFVQEIMEKLGDEEIWGDNSYRKKKNMNLQQKSAKDEIDILYEDDKWIILTPKTYEASVYWGNGTAWCTAYKDERDYYDDYTNQGPLFININKETREKYQFHFQSDSFMNKSDNRLRVPILPRMGASDGMIKFYEKLCGKHKNEFRFLFDDLVYVEEIDGVNIYNDNAGKYVFIYGNGKEIKDIDRYEEFYDSLIFFKRNGKENAILTDKNLIANMDTCEQIDGTYWFIYTKEGKYGMFSYEPNYMVDGLYKEIIQLRSNKKGWEFDNLVALRTNDYYEIFNIDEDDLTVGWGEITKINTEYIDEIEGFKVYNEQKKMNLVNYEGKLVFDDWVDAIIDDYVFSKQYGTLVVVENDGLYNLIGDGGTPLSNIWFHELSSNGKNANVILNGNHYLYMVDEGVIINKRTHKGRYVTDY